MKKIIFFLILGVIIFSGCVRKNEDTNNNQIISERITKINVTGTDFVCNMIGVKANAVGITGTDLGTWVVKERDGQRQLLCFFGDVISPQSLSGGSSAMLRADIPVNDCTTFSWITNTSNRFYEPIVSKRVVGDESTVPSGAIQINDTIYLFAQRITKWGEDYNPETTDGYGVLFKDIGENNFEEIFSWNTNQRHLNTVPVLGNLSTGEEVVFMAITGK